MITEIVYVPTQETIKLPKGTNETLTTYLNSYISQFKNTRIVFNSRLGELVIQHYLLSGKNRKLTRNHFAIGKEE